MTSQNTIMMNGVIRIDPIICFVKHLNPTTYPRTLSFGNGNIEIRVVATNEFKNFFDTLVQLTPDIFNLEGFKRQKSFSIHDILTEYKYCLNILAPSKMVYGDVAEKSYFWRECVNAALRTTFGGPAYCDFCIVIKGNGPNIYKIGRSYHPNRADSWVSNVDWPGRDSYCVLDDERWMHLLYTTSYLAFYPESIEILSDFIGSYYFDEIKDRIEKVFRFIDFYLTCGKSGGNAYSISNRGSKIISLDPNEREVFRKKIQLMYNTIRCDVAHGNDNGNRYDANTLHEYFYLSDSLARSLINFSMKYNEIHRINLLANKKDRLIYLSKLDKSNENPLRIAIKPKLQI